MTKPITSSILATVFAVAASLLTVSSVANAADKTYAQSVRIGYVPHSAFLVDNGIGSGALSPLMECSTDFFERIEYVEMPSYDRMMLSLESNVIDIGLNMVKTKKRDKQASYAMDLYRSRIIMVSNKDNPLGRQESLGVVGVRKGSEMVSLLAVKGLVPDLAVKSMDQLFNMYRKGYIDSFPEAEISVIDYLHALDEQGVDYDYATLSEKSGGAYVSFEFAKSHPKVIPAWKERARRCAYLAPKIDN